MSPLVIELAEKRREQRASVRSVADRVEVHPNTIFGWERGAVEPGLSNFVACVEALGGVVKIEWRE